MRIVDLLAPQAIRLNQKASTKEEAINELVDLMSTTDCLNDPNRFREAVFDRESKVSTGLGAGVAIPHAKSAGVTKPGLAAMVVPDGVDFDSLDGLPTHLFFLIASPHQASDAHLDVLARLSTLLVSNDFRESLINAKSVDEFLQLVSKAEEAELAKHKQEETKLDDENSSTDEDNSYDLVAVTACPAGLSHTYMAAEALEKQAKQMGLRIKIETDGAAGNRNRLLPEDIARAKAVIVAADRIVEMDRFIGKPLVRVGVVDGIRKPKELIERALDPKCSLYQTGVINNTSSLFMRLYRHLMSGMTYIMPIVATAGILSAIARIDLIQGNQFALFLDKIGYSIGTLLFPILSAFIAFSIRGRTALVAGFTGGVMADMTGAGVIGAVINGFVGGGVALLTTAFAMRFLKGHDAIVALLVYPLVGALGTSCITIFFTNIPSQFIDEIIQSSLTDAPSYVRVLVGLVIAGMMSADMGGPFNKVAYAVGVLLLADCLPETGVGGLVMGSVMAGGMIPPLAAVLASVMFPQLFTKEEKKQRKISLAKGLVFITEGVIPFISYNPNLMRIACILGSATAGALSFYYNCAICAPHGGVFIIPLAEHAIKYVECIAIGTLVGAFAFGILRLHDKSNKALEENK